VTGVRCTIGWPARGSSAVRKLATCIATAGYVGLIPVVPGTFGSAAGLLVYAAVRYSPSPALEAVVILLTLAAGMWAADVVERDLGKDPAVVVIDEVVGMLITVAFIDVSLLGGVMGFLLFRVLDVVKPFPAGRLEHLRGGPGIMLDDVFAGIYSNLALRGLVAAFPGVFA
jgi:phosphatidylglycerophosphatase A